MKQDCDLYAMRDDAGDNGRVRGENARPCEKKERVLRWSWRNERRHGMRFGRDTDKGTGTEDRGMERTVSEGRGG